MRARPDLSGPHKMIGALEKLQRSVNQPHLPEQMAAFGISGKRGSGFKRLFMTHPPLEERIARLRQSPGSNAVLDCGCADACIHRCRGFMC